MMDRHDDLRQRAEALLRLSKKPGQAIATREDGAPRPLFIEFTGTPKSGKSSCIESVRHFFHRVGFSVTAPSEGASRRNPRHLKNDLTAFNTWSACYAISQVLENLFHPGKFDIAILDRGLFDSVAWFQLLEKRTEITPTAARTVQDFILLDKWRNVIDVVTLMQADPTDCMKRENQNKLIEKTGRAMNLESLGELNEVYNHIADKYSAGSTPWLRLDSSDTGGQSLEDAARTVVDFTLGVMEANMK